MAQNTITDAMTIGGWAEFPSAPWDDPSFFSPPPFSEFPAMAGTWDLIAPQIPSYIPQVQSIDPATAALGAVIRGWTDSSDGVVPMSTSLQVDHPPAIGGWPGTPFTANPTAAPPFTSHT